MISWEMSLYFSFKKANMSVNITGTRSSSLYAGMTMLRSHSFSFAFGSVSFHDR